MNVVLVAQDIAPSNALLLLEAELIKRGHSAKALVGKGKVFPVSPDALQQVISVADVVVIGMSSSAKLAEMEIFACEEALKNCKLFGFYGDTYHCHERAATGSWFGPYNQLADFFLAINEEEAHAARKVLTGVTSDLSVATGNPTWEDYAFPKFTRAQVRAQLKADDDEVLVLAPGGKSPVVNILLNGLLVEALAGLDRKSRILISNHPGDRTPFAVDPDKANAPLNIYSDLKTFSSVPVEFLDASVKTSDVLPGADIVVEWGSSIAIEAAHQRIPVISVSTEVGRKRMLSTSKTEKWEPVELGVAEEVGTNSTAIQGTISCLLDDRLGKLTKLLDRQAEVYPKPQEKGTAVRKMADVLENLVK